jgi:hypothetical protein
MMEIEEYISGEDCCNFCTHEKNNPETYPCTECFYIHDRYPNWGTKWEKKRDPPQLKTRFELLKMEANGN